MSDDRAKGFSTRAIPVVAGGEAGVALASGMGAPNAALTSQSRANDPSAAAAARLEAASTVMHDGFASDRAVDRPAVGV
jgi:hypothetical protein